MGVAVTMKPVLARFRLGAFELGEHDLVRRLDGLRVPLPPKALTMLFVLAEAEGSTVGLDTLRRRIWPDQQLVQADTIHYTVSVLRKRLREAGAEGEVIAAIPKQGYSLALEVTPLLQPVTESALVRQTRSAIELSRSKLGRRWSWAPALALLIGVALWVGPLWVARRPRAQAQRLCGEALKLWNRRGNQSVPDALVLYRKATLIDPGYAPAYLGVANCLAFGQTPVRDAEAALKKAMDLNPSSGEAYATRGFIRMVHYWDWTGSENDFRRAIRLAPFYATGHQWLGVLLQSLERFSEAEAELAEAARLDPDSDAIQFNQAELAYATGRDKSAILSLGPLVKRNPDFSRAGMALTKMLSADRISAILLMKIYFPYYLTQAREKGLTEAWRASCVEPTTMSEVLIAENCMLADEPGRALHMLEQAYREHDFFLFGVKGNHYFKPLHSEPRFQAILRGMNFR
jgi:DNA-binding winged helix-turn-helix (wHTH) protein